MSDWVFGPDVGLPDDGWMSQEEYQGKLNPATQILPTVEASQELRAAVVPTSQNGFPSNNRALIVTLTAGGVQFPVRKGACGELLMWAAERWHREVEPLVPGTCWGYAERLIRGSSTQLSNHSSGTALDFNAPKHPLGTNPNSNYTAAQISAIHRIIDDTDGALRWGGDYGNVARGGVSGSRPDGMHVEINAPEGHVAGVLAQVTGGDDMASVWDRREGPWEGGISNIPPGGKQAPEEYDLMMYVKRNNVNTYQTALMVRELLEKRAVAPQVKLDVDRLANTLAAHPAIAALKAPEPEQDVVDEIVSVPFWKAAFERCAKTVVQTLLVLAVPSSGLFDAFSMDWKTTGGLALSAGLLSILTSLASAPIGGTDSPSLLKGGTDG